MLNVESLVPDLMMACLGAVVSLLWDVNPRLILLALSPLVMIERALAFPQLRQEARVDSKTGLWNARHFAGLFKAELKRAKRFGHQVALIVGDLDLLRNINNIPTVIWPEMRCSRESGRSFERRLGSMTFRRALGGEFVVALPETGAEDGSFLMEQLRLAVEAHEFGSKTSAAPIHATISLGCACFPMDAATTTDLIHAADMAAYQAKLQGRNRSVTYSELPHSIGLEFPCTREHLEIIEEGFPYFSPETSGLRVPEAAL